MSLHGHVKNGSVVLHEPLPWPDGTPVIVEAVPTPPPGFWQSYSLDELAVQQDVSAPRSPVELLGGWPMDELDDDFDGYLQRWREAKLEQQR